MPARDWLCRYQYDALDRLAGRLPDGTTGEQCFYQDKRLTTVVDGQHSSSWLQTASQILSQQRQNPNESVRVLIGSDQFGSVIHGLMASGLLVFAYTAYGYRQPAYHQLQLPGFNRERPDPVTGYYLLGNGHRAYSPLLMRLHSPDSLSPFAEGGLNAYTYCTADPVNNADPSGQAPISQWVGNLWRRLKPGRARQIAGPLSMRPSQAPDFVVVAGKTLHIDKSSMSSMPLKQGPLTADQTYTVRTVAANLPASKTQSTLTQKAAAKIPFEHLQKLPAEHPVRTNQNLKALVLEGQRTNFAQAYLQSGSDQHRLVLATNALRRYPQIFPAKKRHARTRISPLF